MDDELGKRLIADFCVHFRQKGRDILVAYAAQVVVMAQISSLRQTAEYFSKLLQRPISKQPVEDLLRKVRSGEISVTDEEIRQAAKADPLAEELLRRKPFQRSNSRTSKGKPKGKWSSKTKIQGQIGDGVSKVRSDRKIELPTTGVVTDKEWLAYAKAHNIPTTRTGDYDERAHAEAIGKDKLETLSNEMFAKFAGFQKNLRSYPDRGTSHVYADRLEQEAQKLKRRMLKGL